MGFSKSKHKNNQQNQSRSHLSPDETIEFDSDETTVVPAGSHLASNASGSSKGSGKKHRTGRAVLIVLCILVALVVIAYVGISFYFTTHFGFGTTISGIDCSLCTVEEVEALLDDVDDSYTLTIYERSNNEATEIDSDASGEEDSSDKTDSSESDDAEASGENADDGSASSSDNSSSESSDESTAETASYSETYESNLANNTGITGSQTETIAGSDIGMSYDSSSGQVEALLEEQDAWTWFQRLFSDEEEESKSIEFAYDEELLQQTIASLACMDNSDAVSPEDAYTEYDGTTYVIRDEIPGNTVDTEAAQALIEESIRYAVTELDLSESGCYLAPETTSASEDLIEYVALLDEYVPFALTYTFSDGSTEVLDGATIFEWLTINDDGSYTVDESQVEAWVADFEDRHCTVGHERTFTSVDGNTYTVSGGTYGWCVDESEEIAAIEEMLETKESVTREPYWVSTAASGTADGSGPDWGDTYIELNITTQHMYYIVDGEIALEADVVTGQKDENDTPTGVYYILEKAEDKTLRGEELDDGTYEYETPVNYWMRMTWTGVGFHDATWRSAFGDDIYASDGSHGCINMSIEDAETLYGLIEVGTPVVSHT